jgi:hypothetical protein
MVRALIAVAILLVALLLGQHWGISWKVGFITVLIVIATDVWNGGR